MVLRRSVAPRPDQRPSNLGPVNVTPPENALMAAVGLFVIKQVVSNSRSPWQIAPSPSVVIRWNNRAGRIVEVSNS